MSRLPSIGGDSGNWGKLLNEYLSVSHNADGTLKNRGVNVKDYGATGDGVTDDTSAILSARDAADTGGTVIFPPGTYAVTTLGMTKVNQTWNLQPGATIKSLPSNSAQGCVLLPAATGLTITGGGAIDGNEGQVTTDVSGIYSSSSSVTDLTVDGITIQNCKGYGLCMSASRTIVRSCKFANCATTHVEYIPVVQIDPNGTDIYDCAVIDCVVDSSMLDAGSIGGDQIFVGGAPRNVGSRGYTKNVYHARIIGNTVLAPSSPTNTHGSVICIAFGALRSVCANNTMRGGSMGISADGADESSITGNTIFGPNWYGIEIPSSFHLSVVGNTINGNGILGTGGGGGLSVIETTSSYNSDWITISDNVMSNYTSNGIVVSTGGYHVISNNVLDASVNGGGIVTSVADVSITGNFIIGPGYATSRGIRLGNHLGRTSITGNTLKNWTHGIDFIPTSVIQDYVTITGNNFSGCTININDGHIGSGSLGSHIKVVGNTPEADYSDFAGTVAFTNPTGSAGGDLGGSYPNPSVNAPTIKLLSGYYYSSLGAAGSAAVVQNTLTLSPFVVPTSTAFDRIGVNVATGAGSTTVRLGVYADSNGIPGALVFDAGTIDSSGTGIKTLTISQTLAAGRYWLAAVAQGGSPTLNTLTGVGLPTGDPNLSSNAGSGHCIAYTMTGVTGALPTFTIGGVGYGIRVILRKQ